MNTFKENKILKFIKVVEKLNQPITMGLLKTAENLPLKRHKTHLK